MLGGAGPAGLRLAAEVARVAAAGERPRGEAEAEAGDRLPPPPAARTGERPRRGEGLGAAGEDGARAGEERRTPRSVMFRLCGKCLEHGV